MCSSNQLVAHAIYILSDRVIYRFRAVVCVCVYVGAL